MVANLESMAAGLVLHLDKTRFISSFDFCNDWLQFSVLNIQILMKSFQVIMLDQQQKLLFFTFWFCFNKVCSCDDRRTLHALSPWSFSTYDDMTLHLCTVSELIAQIFLTIFRVYNRSIQSP